jgi:hypothetical protein
MPATDCRQSPAHSRIDVECLERADVAIDMPALGVGRDPELAPQIGLVVTGPDRYCDGEVC